MNRFYVEEGNKRVSVLKYFGAVSVPAYVIRIIPPQTTTRRPGFTMSSWTFTVCQRSTISGFPEPEALPDCSVWWASCPMNRGATRTGRIFTQPTRSSRKPSTPSTKRSLRSCRQGPSSPPKRRARTKRTRRSWWATPFLYYIDLYGYDSLFQDSAAELKTKLKKTRDEFLLLKSDQSVALQMDPGEGKKKSLLLRLIPTGTRKLKVCFLYARTIDTSSWTYAHDLGRSHLQKAFPTR